MEIIRLVIGSDFGASSRLKEMESWKCYLQLGLSKQDRQVVVSRLQ
jgi:hypothetical protein